MSCGSGNSLRKKSRLCLVVSEITDTLNKEEEGQKIWTGIITYPLFHLHFRKKSIATCRFFRADDTETDTSERLVPWVTQFVLRNMDTRSQDREYFSGHQHGDILVERVMPPTVLPGVWCSHRRNV